ncbi:MAG: SprB repeat-containing protein [Bacteroidales bacterium]|nr:SprB repeat-containing protein [Bacteroidales bacterium]
MKTYFINESNKYEFSPLNTTNSYEWSVSPSESVETIQQDNNSVTLSFSKVESSLLILGSTDNCIIADTIEITAIERNNNFIVTGSITPANGITNSGGAIDISIFGGTENANYVYKWSNGQQTPDINNLSVGEYIVTVFGSQSDSTVATCKVGYSKEHIELIYDDELVICQGSSAILSAIDNEYIVSYTWSTGEKGRAISAAKEGMYTVSAVFSSGLRLSDSIMVAYKNIGEFELVGPSNVMVGAIVKYKHESEFSYQNEVWSMVPESMGSIVNTETGVARAGFEEIGQAYIKTTVWADGCSISDSIMVSVSMPQNEILISGIVTPASGITNTGGSIDIEVSSVSELSYTYKWSNGSTSQDINTLSVGEYSVTVSASNGESATMMFKIGFTNDLVDLIYHQNQTICNGDSLYIKALSLNAVSYSWNTADTGYYILVKKSGMYSVKATFASGLIITDSIQISVDSIPVPQIFGDTLVLVNQFAEYSFEPVRNDVFYFWSLENDLGTIIGNTKKSAVCSVQFKQQGLENMILVSNYNQCSRTDEYAVEIKAHSYTLVIAGSSKPANGITNSGGSISAIVGGGKSPYTYSWSTGDTTASIEKLKVGEYTLTVTDVNGVFAKRSFTVGFTQLNYELITEAELKVCQGNSAYIQANDGDAAISSFTWNTGYVGNPLPINENGWYSVEALFESGMTATDSVLITFVTVPSVIIVGDEAVAAGSLSVIDFAPKTKELKYSWTLNDDNYGEITTLEDSSAQVLWGSNSGTAVVQLHSIIGQCDVVTEHQVKISPSVGIYSVSGSVYTSSVKTTNVKIYVYKADDSVTVVKTVSVSESGDFTISNLDKGDYILYAKPEGKLATKYEATYYVSTLDWNKANKLHVDGNIIEIDIKLLKKVTTEIVESSSDVMVYPNPADDYFYIESLKEEVEKVQLYTADGKFLFETNEKMIYIGNLSVATYRCLIFTKEAVYSEQIIKK